MAGGGSSEVKGLQLAVAGLQSVFADLAKNLESEQSRLRQRVVDLERQVASLQSALRGGDVGPAGGKPRPPDGGVSGSVLAKDARGSSAGAGAPAAAASSSTRGAVATGKPAKKGK